MLRVNENKRLLKGMPQQLEGTPPEITNRLLSMIYHILADISKSQAILADKARQDMKRERAEGQK